jgi:hypothetical protein
MRLAEAGESDMDCHLALYSWAELALSSGARSLITPCVHFGRSRYAIMTTVAEPPTKLQKVDKEEARKVGWLCLPGLGGRSGTSAIVMYRLQAVCKQIANQSFSHPAVCDFLCCLSTLRRISVPICGQLLN